MSSKTPLKRNPFTTYRDPATGRWIVVQPVVELSEHENALGLSIVSSSLETAELQCA